MRLVTDFFKIFTWDKSFHRNHFIGSELLNRLGLHVIRVISAHALFRLRLHFLGLLHLTTLDEQKSFIRDGVLVIPDFLAADAFEALKQEILNYQGSIRDVIEGSTLTQRIYLKANVLRTLPEATTFTQSKRLTGLLRLCSSKNRLPLFYIENIRQHYLKDNRPDPQKDLHSDTFHPSVKAWLFLDDVDQRNGPFTFSVGSQKLTFKRIAWEYHESIKASINKHHASNERYWDGSFRISAHDLESLNYQKPSALSVRANTLVIANTYGFHCRGNATSNQPRLSIWMQMRDNPFNPIPNLMPKLAYKINERVWAMLMKKRDTEMAKNGELIVHQSRLNR